jgi:acetylornithine/N-succinyldiaminopimelate aminotransferase
LRLRDGFEGLSTDGQGLDGHVLAVGACLYDGLLDLASRFPAIAEAPRGRGLMLGLPIREPYQAREIAAAAREQEFLLVNAAGRNTVRLVPPLVLSLEEAHDGLARLERVLGRLGT